MTIDITSPRSKIYNCIAWAAGDNRNFWWPIGGTWPHNVPREESLEAFIQAYNTRGYQICDNESLEENFEKIAIYTDENNIPKHAAKQLPTGRWSSKLGRGVDVEHELHNLRQYVLNITADNTDYGTVSVILKKPLSSNQ